MKVIAEQTIANRRAVTYQEDDGQYLVFLFEDNDVVERVATDDKSFTESVASSFINGTSKLILG